MLTRQLYAVFRKKHPLLFSFITSSQTICTKISAFIAEWILTMFKNSPSICYIFFAVDDVIVTSVNTCMSMMGISTEDKYMIKSLRENKNMEQSDCLNCFLTKTEVLMNWKRWSKQLTTQVLCGQCEVDHYPLRRTAVCCQFFLSALSATKTPVFVMKLLSNHFAPYFLFSGKDLIKYLSSVLIPIIDV